MFRGCFEHTIDDKGRLSIPAKFREALDTTFCAPLIVTRHKECLVAYPSDQWKALEEEIGKLPTFSNDVRMFQRFFYAPAQECPTDRAGRILVPPTLRAFAELDKQVVLAGMGKFFEIWAQERYEKMMNAALDNFDGITQSVGDLGL